MGKCQIQKSNILGASVNPRFGKRPGPLMVHIKTANPNIQCQGVGETDRCLSSLLTAESA